jgi:hypothetical protein
MAQITDGLDCRYRKAQPRERNEERSEMKEEKKLFSDIQEEVVLHNS